MSRNLTVVGLNAANAIARAQTAADGAETDAAAAAVSAATATTKAGEAAGHADDASASAALARDISNIDTTDDAVDAALNLPGSKSAATLSASIDSRVDTIAPGVVQAEADAYLPVAGAATFADRRATPLPLARFGAVGDAVADDTAAIQAAIDEVSVGDGVPAVALAAGAGTFRITSTIEIQRKAVIVRGFGAGNPSDASNPGQGTTFVWDGPAGQPMFRIRDAQGVVFEDVFFAGNDATPPSELVYLENDSSPSVGTNQVISFWRCAFGRLGYVAYAGHTDSGYCVRWGGTNINNDQAWFHDCMFAGATEALVALDNSNTLWCSFSNCYFDGRLRSDFTTPSVPGVRTNAVVALYNAQFNRCAPDFDIQGSGAAVVHMYNTENSAMLAHLHDNGGGFTAHGGAVVLHPTMTGPMVQADNLGGQGVVSLSDLRVRTALTPHPDIYVRGNTSTALGSLIVRNCDIPATAYDVQAGTGVGGLHVRVDDHNRQITRHLKASEALPAPSDESGHVGPRQALNVRDYGAMGDGSTDDTAAIQRAVTAAVARQVEVYIPGGTYLVSAAITSTTGTVIKGAGQDKTTISSTHGGAIFVSSTVSTRTYRWHISNMRLNGPGSGVASSVGIDLASVSGAHIENVLAENLNKGFRVRSSINGGAVYNRFTNCTANLCTYGFSIEALGSNSTALDRCRGNACVRGVSIVDSNNNSLVACQLESNTIGLFVDATSNALADCNTAIACRFESNTSTAWQVASANVRDFQVLYPQTFGTYTVGDSGTRTRHAGVVGATHTAKDYSTAARTEGSWRYERTVSGGAETPAFVVRDSNAGSGTPVTHQSETERATGYFYRGTRGGVTYWDVDAAGNVRSPQGGYAELTERVSDPPAPAANGARLYLKDDGAGKTQLCVLFSTGVAQIIATEP